MEEENSALRPSGLRWAVVSIVVVTIVFYGLTVLHSTGWSLPDFQRLILEQWRSLLFWLGIWLLTAVVSVYVFYLLARVVSNRPQILFFALLTIGILLLLAALKGNPSSQYIYDWVDRALHIDMLSASITVVSLAVAIGAILLAVRRGKE